MTRRPHLLSVIGRPKITFDNIKRVVVGPSPLCARRRPRRPSAESATGRPIGGGRRRPSAPQVLIRDGYGGGRRCRALHTGRHAGETAIVVYKIICSSVRRTDNERVLFIWCCTTPVRRFPVADDDAPPPPPVSGRVR